jgi:hypothetical protein
MSDRLFPDEGNQYEFEEEEEEKSRIQELLKKVSEKKKSIGKKFKSSTGKTEPERSEPGSPGFGREESGTNFDIERERNENSLFDILGPKSYLVYGVEGVLVLYFILALLGFVPMF